MASFSDGFVHRQPAVRVRFGAGSIDALADEAAGIGARRAFVLTTPQQADLAERAAALLGGRAAGAFTGAAMHTPVEVTERAMAEVTRRGADCLVSLGGGSATGLSKALAYRTDLPQIVVPTTYAGSEATAILGQTEAGLKTTLSDPKVQPEVILYDPDLVVSLPVPMTVASAFNAMAHAVEALYARDRTPLSSVLAFEGLRAFAQGLPATVAAPGDTAARAETLYGAWLCGTVLGQVGMALHHKLCHTLGGTFDLPHAETHAIMLPHATAYNAAAVSELLAPVAVLFDADDPGRALHDFARRTAAPLALRDLGLGKADLDRAVEMALKNPYWNPRPIEAAPLRRLLQRAWSGDPPAAD